MRTSQARKVGDLHLRCEIVVKEDVKLNVIGGVINEH